MASGNQVQTDSSGYDLDNSFKNAANHLKTIVSKLEIEQILYLYARFKQATSGQCDIPKPGFFDFQGKQKWDAWKSLGEMSSEQAMKEYIDFVARIDPSWEKDCEVNLKSDISVSPFGGVAVSCMQPPDEEPIADENKSLNDWVVEGNVEEVSRLLMKNDSIINQTDDQGMAALHWACDRGHAEMVQLLLEKAADPNVRDADNQTPLHYACFCGHVEVAKLLISATADCNLTDCQGLKPAELAADPQVQDLFMPKSPCLQIV